MQIIHRDLKLENIIMSNSTKDAKPKIIDFGISLINDETCTTSIGTLGFSAPEIFLK